MLIHNVLLSVKLIDFTKNKLVLLMYQRIIFEISQSCCKQRRFGVKYSKCIRKKAKAKNLRRQDYIFILSKLDIKKWYSIE